MRAGALSDAEVGEYLNKHFVSAWKRVGTFTAIQKAGKTVARAGGNVAIYFCTPDLDVVHAVAGPVAKEGLLASAKWAVEAYRKALEQSKGDREGFVTALRKAHEEEAPKTRNCRGEYIRLVEAVADVPVRSQLNPDKEKTDRPAPPGNAVYHCVPAEDLAHAQQAVAAPPAGCKAEVIPALHRIEPQERSVRRTAVLVGGGRNLHGFLAQQGLPKLDEVYRHVFEGVLGQQVTDTPVVVREMPQGRVYTCQSMAAARAAQPPPVEIQDLNAKLKAAMEQIELLKKQVEELKKAQ